MTLRLRLAALGTVLALVSAFAVLPAMPTQAAHANKVHRGSLSSGGGIPTAFTSSTGTGTITGLTITGFQAVNGVLQAVGTATGTFTPTGGTATSFTSPFTANLSPASATCPILSLTLGPINLNLLGLVITTNQINVNITAVPGPGNLLGNLLCAVANLLNGNGVLGNLLGRLAGLLNGLLGPGGLTL